MDINGDGFPDIIMPQVGNFDRASTAVQTWANQVLINTGTGKFVQAMWNEFHEMTLSQEQLVPPDGFSAPGLEICSVSTSRSAAWASSPRNTYLNGVFAKLGFENSASSTFAPEAAVNRPERHRPCLAGRARVLGILLPDRIS